MTKPKHYQVRIEPVTYILENGLGFLEGSIVKRLTRYEQKDGLQDLYKARTEIDMLIKQKEKEKEPCKSKKSTQRSSSRTTLLSYICSLLSGRP